MTASATPGGWAPGELAPRPGAAPRTAMLRAQTRTELVLLLRNGEQVLLSLVIPVGLLVVLTVLDVVTVEDGVRRVDYFTPGVLALAVMSTAFTGQAIATGFERQYGVLKRLGATPLRRGGLIAAKTSTVLVVELGQTAVIIVVGLLLGWSPDAQPAAALWVPVLILAGTAVALWLYVRFSLAPCALVLERTGIGASLRRSAVLVRRDWWRVFGILLLTVVIGTFVSQVVQLPFSALGAGGFSAMFDPDTDVLGARSLVVSAIGGGLAATLVAPFTAGVRALLYVDRRIRAEGLDVSLSAAAASRT